eukprot:gene636-1227_t
MITPFSLSTNCDLRKFAVNMVPFPRLHLFMINQIRFTHIPRHFYLNSTNSRSILMQGTGYIPPIAVMIKKMTNRFLTSHCQQELFLLRGVNPQQHQGFYF